MVQQLHTLFIFILLLIVLLCLIQCTDAKIAENNEARIIQPNYVVDFELPEDEEDDDYE